MKENISRENYEVWLIDYIDGNLTSIEKEKVEFFLEANPDIKDELAELEMLPADDLVIFENKDQLKKEAKDLIPSGISSLDEFMIANLEGELDIEQQKKFRVLINSDKNIEKEYNYYLQTKANADRSIVFTEKALLKKGVIYKFPTLLNQYSYLTLIAAVLLVLLIMVNISSIMKSYLNTEGITIIYDFKDQDQKNRFDWSYHEDHQSENKFVAENKDVNNIHLATLNSSSQTTKVNVNEILRIEKNLQNQKQEINIAEQNRNKIEIDKSEIIEQKFRIEKESEPVLAMTTPQATPVNKYIAKQFRERVLNDEVSAKDNRKLSVWDFADLGLQRIGKLFNREMKLNKEYDEEGELIALAYQSPNLGFTAPLKKNRP